MRAIMRFLLVKTSSMGDLVHNLPMVADIRHRFPDAVIDWVAEESFAEIARMSEDVAQVIPVALRRWKRQLFRAQTWKEMAACRRTLQSQRYDVILDTQCLIKSALLAHTAHGPSHGQDRDTAREGIASSFYDFTHHIPRDLHAVTRNRMLAAEALGYALPQTPPEYRLHIPQTALPLTLPERYAVLLHGTSRESKLWPEQHWIDFCRAISHDYPRILLPWGNETERLRAERIAAQVPQAAVLPQLNLTQLARIMQQSQLIAGVDTGLMHLAVGLYVPTLAIFRDTDVTKVGPFPPSGAPVRTIDGKGTPPTVDEVMSALPGIQRS
jgi:heptosyltransferase-1